MKQHITVGLSILAVVATMAGMGWKLAGHQETSTGLEQIRLIQSSEHSRPGAAKELAGIRIRISPSDFDGEIRTTAHEVPPITLAAE